MSIRAIDPALSYATYSAQFLTRDFIALIEDMEDIERQLQQDVHLAILEILTSHGAEIRGDVIELNDGFYKLLISASSRELHVVMADLSRNQATPIAIFPINGFGLIREVAIELPTSFGAINEALAEAISAHYIRAYTALETAYISGYGDWVARLFSMSYGIVNTELLVRGYADLRDRFWFSVTDLDRMTFRYHFSRDNLASTVDWLRGRQDQFVSPCAAATLLVTEDVADGVIGVPVPAKSTRYDESTLIVEFAALPTLGVNTAYWVAERNLFENEALAAIHLYDVDDRAFELNCAADSVGTFRAIIDGCSDDLVNVMREQYAGFKREQRKLHRAVERAKESVSWMHSMSTDFAAKVVAELIKT